MEKERIVKEIKSNTENYMFQAEIDSYVEGYLDALCKTREITWEERYEIEGELDND